jgi:tetrahydromethanopterin S-methyltransferase subunit G
MFSSLKIGLVLVMLAGAGGGYLYVQKLQKDNAILKENQLKLEGAVEEQKQVIEKQAEDFRKIRDTLNKLEEVNKKLEQDKAELNKRLGKHDIGNLAENKPGLVERIINGASKSAARCVEIASGSPLTEEELNGTPNRECPSFWPTP